MKFKLRNTQEIGIRSPIETTPPRGSGFKQGGRTGGNAREWVIDNGTVTEVGAYDIKIIPLE